MTIRRSRTGIAPKWFRFGACLFLLSLFTPGCARVVVTRDSGGNTTSVDVEPMFSAPSGKAPGISAQTSSISQMEVAVFERINEQRQKQGLKPLKMHETLRKVARAYSRRMSQEKFFSHYDPQKKSATDRVRSAGLRFRAVGENLFLSQNAPDPISGAVEGWMESKGHRANILTQAYTHTGVGIWKDGNTHHFTQLFMRPL